MPDPNQGCPHTMFDVWQIARALATGNYLSQHDPTKTLVKAFFMRGIDVSLKGTGSLGLFQCLFVCYLAGSIFPNHLSLI